MKVKLVGLLGVLFSVCLIDGSNGHIVERINELNVGFKARHYPEFDNLTLQQLLQFAGAPINHHKKKSLKPLNNNGEDDLKKSKLEKNFDVRDKWPECKKVVEDIQIQANCSSSWAIATATSIRDRRCIKYSQTDSLSSWDIVTCATDGNGCLGSDHDTAFQFFLSKGIVTGGKFQSHQGCKPYPLKPGSNAPPSDTQCHKSCQSSYNKNYNDDKVFGSDQTSFQYANKDVMEEIKNNGPVVAEFQLYEDFAYYSHGVYQHKLGNLIGYHYVKVVGWGMTDDGQKFWTATNSWGQNWGENGFFRILRDTDESNFEANLIAGNVTESRSRGDKTTTKKPIKTTLKTTTKEPIETTTINLIPHDQTCQNIIGYYIGTFQQLKNPPTRKFDAQFEFRINADLNYNMFYWGITNWNQSYTVGGELWLDLNYGDSHCHTPNKNCSVPFTQLHSTVVIEITTGGTRFGLLQFPFKNSFKLNHTINGCTNYQPFGADYDETVAPNPSLLSYCLCCDEYNPHPSLNCPVNPWQGIEI